MVYASGSESAAETGDYVGVESCIDLRNEEEFEEYVKDCERSYDRWKLSRRREEEREVEVGETIGDVRWRNRKELSDFPPPITCLARTANHPSHMPWVMKRYLTDDGRLVIREEKVRHHEYFRAHRADGRLTLQLIPLFDNNFYASSQLNNSNDAKMVKVDKEEKGSEAIPVHVDSNVDGNVEDMEIVNENAKEENEEKAEAVARVMVTSVSMAALCGGGMLTSASSSSLSGGGNTCYGFNSLGSTSSASSLFHLQAPPIRPVIS